MNTDEIKKLVALLGLLAIAGCGSGAGVKASGVGALAITVSNAKGFNPRIEHAKIEKYRVKVEGPGIIEPISAEFSGDATEGYVEGVPVGDERKISVDATNPNGSVIRAGDAIGVSIGDGENVAAVELLSVPIVTNIKEGGYVDNTRLVFHIFSDPAHRVTVEDSSGGDAVLLADAAANTSEIELDVSTGFGRLAPGLIPAGSHEFIVRDLQSEKSSKININVMDGTKRKPAPLFSGSESNARKVMRFGVSGRYRDL